MNATDVLSQWPAVLLSVTAIVIAAIGFKFGQTFIEAKVKAERAQTKLDEKERQDAIEKAVKEVKTELEAEISELKGRVLDLESWRNKTNSLAAQGLKAATLEEKNEMFEKIISGERRN